MNIIIKNIKFKQVCTPITFGVEVNWSIITVFLPTTSSRVNRKMSCVPTREPDLPIANVVRFRKLQM